MRLLIIAIIPLIIVSQQCGILSSSQILLKPTFALRVDVASTADEAEKHREENQSVRGGPQDEGHPDAEIVDFEDL